MGDRIEDDTSLLYWIAKHRIPMVIPGLSDGSIGAQLFMHRQKNPNFMVDFLADEQILRPNLDCGGISCIDGWRRNFEAPRNMVESVS